MTSRSDHYFSIGQDHIVSGHPCQDHALSYHDDMGACAVVSDGCSSGKETDMGARLITFTTLQALKEAMKNKLPLSSVPVYVGARSKQMRNESKTSLGLAEEDLLATRIYALVTDLYAYLRIEGDGVVAWKKEDGSAILIRYDWAYNTPCYPAYDRDDFASFIESQSVYEEQGLSESMYAWSEQEGFSLLSERVYPIQDGVAGIAWHWEKEAMKELSLIALLSDGVTRVEGLDWKDAALRALSFKNVNGQFVKRRLIRMNKDFSKEGFRMLDDLACAAIHIIPEGDEDDNSQK